MKYFKNYLSALAVFLLLFTSCSKEESSSINEADANFVELTFGAALNDLANKAMNKQSVGDIPDCADTAPDYARINFTYGGDDYEVVVDILQDANGYFTDYSESLKIPVATNGSTTVTLTGFLVYDSNDDIIWAAPIGSDFASYVDQVLPRSFDVASGTKPYIDVEVLCFDRRLVNQYGYVFFDIIPETVYALCTFINYCNEEGRHWVANYAVDLYYGTDDQGIQLYDSNDEGAQVSVGTRNNQFYADPLCLVVPGPPANLADDQPYLYMVIHANDWDENYGDVDNSPIPVQLSWNDVQALLNDDGATNEPLHLLIGTCDGALQGDGTIPDPTCDLSDPDADCDNDGIPNKCDADNPNYDSFDCDGDGFINSEDACPNQAGVAGGEGGDGCPEETTEPTCVQVTPCDIEDIEFPCITTFLNGTDELVTVTSLENVGMIHGPTTEVVGYLNSSFNDEGRLVISLTPAVDNAVSGYVMEVRPVGGDENCVEYACTSDAQGEGGSETFINIAEGDDFRVRIKAVICAPVIP